MKRKLQEWFNLLGYDTAENNSFNFFTKEREYIRQELENLNWEKDKHTQEKAIEILSNSLNPNEYIFLVLPDEIEIEISNNELQYYLVGTGKERWENAAKTIVKIGWPNVEKIAASLFVWLLDPNWPGSAIIEKFLLSLPRETLIKKANEFFTSEYKGPKEVYNEIKAAVNELLQQ